MEKLSIKRNVTTETLMDEVKSLVLEIKELEHQGDQYAYEHFVNFN